MFTPSNIALCLTSGLFAAAQGFPPLPHGVLAKQSHWNSDITVSSKETSKICETTSGVKSFAGYVSMGAASLARINGNDSPEANYFYWFFESRKDPANAPFMIWIGGGPGSSSISSAVQEHGPCTVNSDSNSTTINPLSWNNEANIIYIDQPAMTGYSYDKLTNGTIDGVNGSLPIVPFKFSSGIPIANNTFQYGTFGTQDPTKTANSTGNAAAIFWTFTQAWFAEFRQYKPKDNAINIWSVSYGGRYVPMFARYIKQQNDKIALGALDALPLHLSTVGLINAYIDPVLHAKSYPQMAFNNTYNISVPKVVHDSMQQNLTMPGGCIDQMADCNNLATKDPDNNAMDPQINGACATAYLFCLEKMQAAFPVVMKRNQNDIGHSSLDPFPPMFYTGFLNQAWVQQALGARVNFTANSNAALLAFVQTGDLARQGAMAELGELLDEGTRVSMIYGDRDYQVNWLGGEQISLALPWKGMGAFLKAGYTKLKDAKGDWDAGVVRQVDNLSFTRLFQAGHSAPSYQPAAAYRISMRTLKGLDIAEGKTHIAHVSAPNGGNDTVPHHVYISQGPSSSFHIKNVPPKSPNPICYTWFIPRTCTEQQIGWLAKGTAIVKDYVVTGVANGTNASGAGASLATRYSSMVASESSTATAASTASIVPSISVASQESTTAVAVLNGGIKTRTPNFAWAWVAGIALYMICR